MSSAAVIAIVVGIVVVLGAISFLTVARRSDVRGAGALSRETKRRDRDAEIDLPAGPTGREVERAAVAEQRGGLVKAESMAPAVFVPPDPEAVGVSRRQFFNRATVGLMGAGLTSFAAAGFVAFLWPIASGGFGGKVNVGKRDEIIGSIRSSGGFFYAAEARAWLTEYPSAAMPKAEAVYSPAVVASLEQGLIATYQKCPHLGCRVPSCTSSQWFECPCHGSQYNRVGEKKAGPAPRGMDHFAFTVSAGGDVVVDTGIIYQGVPIGTNTTGQEAEGPHCI
ncbi:MAG: Rieske 2Fe-2S domain-containing protein [Acidimicrobiales bacterium]|nr:Rieske 2Fe-2S domain-containing protein [Acidimicrobiales bacterium]